MGTENQTGVARAKTVEARVLVDHGDHKIDDVIELTPEEAEAAKDWADTSKEAVAFAKAQKKGN